MTPKLTLREPSDLAAAVPYLLGFHPTDSLVVIGVRGPIAAVVQRWDLADDAGGLATAIADLIASAPVAAVMLAGYGEAAAVRPIVAELRDRLPVPVLGAVRVTGDRCFCELCKECTPEEGYAFDITASPVAAQATVAGLAALPSRAALVEQVAPVGGAAAIAMQAAVTAADARLAGLMRRGRDTDDPLGVTAVRAAGFRAVDAALDAGRRGEPLDDDQVAWLTLLLQSLPVRDRAWESTDHEPWQLSLWTDLTRRAEPTLAAPPAAILAFAAWRDGNGPLAGVALERALDSDPDYSLALLIRDAMLRGVPGAQLGSWPSLRQPDQPDRPRRGARSSRGKSSRRRSGEVALR
jgi:hypothetical protein